MQHWDSPPRCGCLGYEAAERPVGGLPGSLATTAAVVARLVAVDDAAVDDAAVDDAAVVEADATAAVAAGAAVAGAAAFAIVWGLATRFLAVGCSSCQFAYVAERHAGPFASAALLDCETS